SYVLGGVRFVFFFSSRRRHTRFSRDWSSDVCSSDLPEGRRRRSCCCSPRSSALPPLREGSLPEGLRPRRGLRAKPRARPPEGGRSEERRVGKEGRARWWP